MSFMPSQGPGQSGPPFGPHGGGPPGPPFGPQVSKGDLQDRLLGLQVSKEDLQVHRHPQLLRPSSHPQSLVLLRLPLIPALSHAAYSATLMCGSTMAKASGFSLYL